MNKEKSLVEDTFIQMKNLEEVISENAKGILASTMKEEIKSLVKESLNEQDEEEVDIEDTETEAPEDEDDLTGEMPDLDEHVFENLYGISKKEYVVQMYCLSLFCKNCYKTILYPGNPTTYIPILKGSFENCYLFKNNVQLF